MVESSIDAGDRDRFALAMKVLFTLLVGASGGLVSIQAGGDREFVVTAVLVGFVVGAVMTWFVVRNLRDIQPEGMRKRREMERRRREAERERDE